MNKTIIININGIVFHIEEDAYEMLRKYMTDIKRHFAYSADDDEIVTDIENRLAEMFNEQLGNQNKQVIVIQDVQEVTAQMGSISDFAADDEDTAYTNPLFNSDKKLYRDVDAKSIAGVCAGIGHYLNIEAKWMRIITVLLIFFTGGTALIVYALLWILVPEAKTRQEKMAMKGEPLNLQNFKKNFDEEVEYLKQGFVKSGMYKSGDAISNFVNQLLAFFTKIIKGIVKLAGLFIVFAGALALFALVMGLVFSLGFWNNEELNMIPFNAINPEFKSPIYFSAFLLVLIPLIALILFAMRVLLNRKLVSRTASFGMLVLWLTGLGMGVYYGSKIASEFKEDARFEQRTVLKAAPVYLLKLNHTRSLTHDDSLKLNLMSGFQGIILTDENDNNFNKLTRFNLYIKRNDETNAVLIKQFKANGKSFESALLSAQKTRYNFLQSDSVLLFDKYLYLADKGLYRNQKINVTLKVPVNTRLIISGDLNRYINNYNLWDCKPEGSPREKPTEWIMTNDGLRCVDENLYKKNQHYD